MRTPASFRYHTLNWPLATFLCVLTAVFAPLCAQAQCSKTVTLAPNDTVDFKFKLKPKRDLNSAQVRIGDYVEFELLEDLKWSPNCGDERQAIITKGTPIIGRVLDRHHRFTIFKKASFGVSSKLTTTTVDGKPIELEFNRPELKRNPKRLDEEPEGKRCVDKTVEDKPSARCVKGRVYAAKFIASLPSAVLSVAAATALVRVKDDAEAAVVGVTLIEKIASQTGLSNILNGVDAEMSAGEIFDAKLSLDKTLVIKLPGDLKKDEHKVGRYTDIPTPSDFVVTDYFSDLFAYPVPPGVVYNGQVIEKHADKPAGATMNICVGQKVPEGWEIINNVRNPKICPEELGHETEGATYMVILKKR